MVQTKYSQVPALDFGYNMGQNIQDDSPTTTILTPVTFPPVLTSGVPVLMSSSSSPSSSEDGVVLAGFQDCSHEALRYLIDVEKIPEDDPLIVGLQQHLWHHQQQMDLAQSFSECLQSMEDSEEESTPDNQTSGRTDSSSSKHIPYELSSSSMDTTVVSHQGPPVQHDDDTESLEDRLSGEFSTAPWDNDNVSEHMADSVLDLALLAQNNPAIASLTEEILGLLEEEQMGTQSITNNDSSTQ